MRTLGIDLGATRTHTASEGVLLPLALPVAHAPLEGTLRAACTAARVEPADVSATVVERTGGPDRAGAIREGARAAGLGAVEWIPAPIAIARAVPTPTSGGRVAVYELGARRFEISIVDRTSGPARLLAREEAAIGGADVDHAIARFVADRIARASGWDLEADGEVWARLLVEAERAKLRLAGDELTSIDVAHADPAAPTQISTIAIDRRGLRELAADTIARTLAACDAVLRRAGSIDAVLLAGGSAMLPGLRDIVGAHLGVAVLVGVEPAGAAAIGASLAAARPDPGPSSASR